MCNINRSVKKIEPEIIVKIRDIIINHSYSDEGLHKASHTGLYHSRQSITDISSARQQLISNGGGSIWIEL